MEHNGEDNMPSNGDQVSADNDTAIDARGFPSSLLPGSRKKSITSKLKEERNESSMRIPRYNMDYPNTTERGYAVIINNENFHWSTGMGCRKGTDADEKNLQRLFNKLDFNLKSYKDQTAGQIRQISLDMSLADHSMYECFVMVILSHGDDGVIYGTDRTLEIKSIVDAFDGKTCPSLAGKPKIFIFQACRGSKHEDPVQPAGDVVDGTEMSEEVLDAGVRPTIPSASDFLFCYSVTEGFYSHRDTVFGSWYVQALVEVFEEQLINRGHEAAMQHDVLDLLTLVNYKVSRRSVERSRNPASMGKKQMPCFLSMLTKKLYLAPKK